MVKYEHTYEATPAMIAVPFSKSLSSPASISMLRTQSGRTQIISTTSSLDPTIEDVETIISESPTDVTEDDIIREGTNEDDESRESAPAEDAEEKEKDEKDEEDEEEQHDTETHESQDFVPHRVDGHTYHEAAMLGLNGTPTVPNANNKNKKKDGTASLASELGHSLRGSMQGLKRENSMSKEIKKPTSQAATSAADDNLAAAAASAAPPANTTVASAPADEKDFVLLDFVPHRADGLTYFEAAMLGLNGTPTADTTGKKKKKSMFSSFFGKKK
mmetsp:Transcript_48230/g.53738  ORF Transcript_48230/g.53738 Transcript_48230/m.53738 type:complete len:274 (+) Transcript_48230:139-960(+)